ncbi:hypothetical protein [Nioella sp.]|uniref:hypothetical protein n=1 Tax=Nioella sp. TaxID=1912091 RepID=UPI003A84D22F
MAWKLCRIVLLVFTLLYGAALLLFLIGTFGWFGQDRDPIAGVFLIPLGLPWNRLIDGLPDPLLAWAAAGAPLVNLVILAGLCRLAKGRLS